MTKVLLTGHNGFLGKHLQVFITQHTDWEIITPATDLYDNPSILEEPVDYIINLASDSSVENSVAHPDDLIDNNVGLMLSLLEYARQYPPKVFLHFSTVEVYNVTNPYAASKVAQEAIADAYWRTYGTPIMIARSPNIVGPDQSPDKFVPKVIEQIKKGETVKIYTSKGVIGSRVYNPVENVCDAILFMLELYPELPKYSKEFPVHFDIGGGQKQTNLEMAEAIAKRLGVGFKYELFEPTDTRPSYTPSLTANGQNLEEYGWRPPQRLTEGLAWIK